MLNLFFIFLLNYWGELNPHYLLEEAHIRESFPLPNVGFSIPSKFKGSTYFRYLAPQDFSLLSLNFDFTLNKSLTLDLYPRFFYENGKWGIVVEPLFRMGEVTGWPNIKWHGALCGAYSKAYFYYHCPSFLMMFGRNRIFLNLGGLLSEEDPPMDMFLALWKSKRFNFSYFLGQLDAQIPTDSSRFYEVGKLYNRYLVGHSLEYKGKRFTLSFSEVALFYTESNVPDLYYLNPFMLYHVRALDTEERGEHNVFWTFSYNYWGKKISFHEEFLVDDFHLPDPVQWAPHKLAWIAKIFLREFPAKGFSTLISYMGATRWTYTHGLSLLYFQNRGEIMGALNDNDFDQVEASIKKQISRNWDIRGVIWYKRKGEGGVREKDIYWESRLDYPYSFFLNGVLEKHGGQGLELLWHGERGLISLELSHEFIWNKDNQRGRNLRNLKIRVSCIFRIVKG